MSRKIPLIRTQFEVYVNGGLSLLGLAEVTLPSLEGLAETLTGAGIMGEIEAIVTGHFSASTTTLNFRILYGSILDYPVGSSQRFDLRSAIEVEDTATYVKTVVKDRWSITGPIKTINPGTVGAASQADASIDIATRRIQHWSDGVEKLLYDPLNNIYTINGVDMYAGIRAAIS